MNAVLHDSHETVRMSHTLNFTTWSPRNAALVAGIALAVMAVLGGFGNFGAIVPLITPGDAATTASAISGSSLLYLSGVVSLCVVILLDFVVAGAWYTLFKPVHHGLSAAAAWIRVIYTVLFAVAISQLVVGFTLLGDPEATLSAVEAFNSIWVTSLGLFGIHLLLIAYLAYRSGFMAKIFPVLLVIAALGYLADAFGMVFVSDFTPVFAGFLFVGEVAIIFWLLIKGRRLPATPPVR